MSMASISSLPAIQLPTHVAAAGERGCLECSDSISPIAEIQAYRRDGLDDRALDDRLAQVRPSDADDRHLGHPIAALSGYGWPEGSGPGLTGSIPFLAQIYAQQMSECDEAPGPQPCLAADLGAEAYQRRGGEPPVYAEAPAHFDFAV